MAAVAIVKTEMSMTDFMRRKMSLTETLLLNIKLPGVLLVITVCLTSIRGKTNDLVVMDLYLLPGHP